MFHFMSLLPGLVLLALLTWRCCWYAFGPETLGGRNGD